MRILQDVRLAFRRMRRTPLFAVSVVGTLALGVGATASIFTVVDAVLLKPLPFPAPHTLVRLTADHQALNIRDVDLSLPELEDFTTRSGAFESLAGIWPISANLTGTERPERIEVLLASANYFGLLGAHAALGRTFNPQDEVPGIATVAVISDGLWRRGFGGDPQVVGRTLRIDEDVYEIIGVMPGSFRHPSATVETDVDVWAPTGWKAAPFPPPGYSAKFMPSAIGRMPRGMSIDEARARVTALGAEITREHPDDYPARVGWTPRVQPLVAHLVEHIRPALLVLMGGIAFVLLIAISNVSNLLLVRAVEREREVAIQRALGAPRSRMLVSFAIEGLVLAVIAGGAGFLASLWGVDLLLRLVPDRLPRVDEIVVDARVFLFAMTTSIVAGLLVSVGPSLQSARADVVERLKASGWGLRGGVRARVRNALVVAQVAIAMVLLAGAALLVRSLSNLQHIETGMRAERVTTARLWLPQPNEPSTGPYFDPARRRALIRGVLDRLQWSADLAEAGIATSLPTADDSGTTAFAVEGWQPERRDIATATVVSATPGYFRALGIGLSAGRFPTDADNEQTDRVAVVNETLARTYFAGADPVGRRICFIGRRGQLPAQPTWMTIVGVARDVREDRIDAAVRPQIYQSLLQAPAPLSLAIVAQGRAKPPSAQVLTSAVQQTDANLPVYAIRTAEDLVAAQLASRRFATTLVNAFAASALLLAAFGLHGVIAYGVRQRTREIGLRLALGATAARIVRLIAGQGARMTALGLTIGTIGALIFSQLISALLFDVKPGDPVTLIAAALLLVGVVALATLGAAWRATRIEAAVALRHD